MSNFAFLEKEWPLLSKLGELAELNLYAAPKTTVVHLGKFAETMGRYLLAYEGLEEPDESSQTRRLHLLTGAGTIPDTLAPMFHAIRRESDRAKSDPKVSVSSAKIHLQFSHRMAAWFCRTFGPSAAVFPSFQSPPEAPHDISRLAALQSEIEGQQENLQEKLSELRSIGVPSETNKARRKTSARVARAIELSEAETRLLIDVQLRASGWQADTLNLRFRKGTRPEKGMNKAIAEWPTASGPADYALFVGLTLVGVIEAKKKAKDVVSDLGQAKRYAIDVQIKGNEAFIGGPWEEYKVPFLFATNGRPYLKQLEQKSGIWFLDGRKSTNHPKPLQAWYTPGGLISLLSLEPEHAHQQLKHEPLDYLGLRDYQEKAVLVVERAMETGRREILVAMATGSGKTRTAIGLVYRLIKTGRFRRVLFLVDRNALGTQTADKFKETRLEDLQTFEQIYDLKEVHEKAIEPETKLHIATVQGMIHRIMFSAKDEEIPSVDTYDCIVVDEAHRGYTLDREMGEIEILYRDEKEYISKYRKVLEYFDSVKIALTATPAAHTIEIFGRPVFTYSYREAVVDGWLIDHEPPHQIETRLKRKGITWKKGDTIPIYDPATGEITNLENIPDEVTLEVDHFNKAVVTENFNRTVCRELVQHLNPDGDEKTLIFAATDDHADLVVQILKEEFENIGCPVDDDAIIKITGSVDKVGQKIRAFKNEKYPNIAVTVDLLTTGIDVPEICNLVFIRCVRSRILYEQMLGRATRRCDKIGKDHFNIYDTVGLYEVLEPVTNMKPVVINPKATFQMLVEELLEIDSEAQQRAHVDELIAKLQRKARALGEEEAKAFETLSGGETLEGFINALRHADLGKIRETVQTKKGLFAFLDENRYQPRKQLISHHEDELASHTRGYGKGEKPEDYLNEFKTFIIDNMNKIPALTVVCQRPRELTRKALRELKLALDQHGYNEPKLQTAWREWKNEDIAADIISFIRRQALGDPLISHKDRIKRAMEKVYSLENWNKIQRQWLERIEKRLLQEYVIERADFNEGAFRDHGGFDRINKIFQGRLEWVLDQINTSLYPEERQYA
ncbi:MAG: type I restriction-modification system endonuclease [Candidatus Hodarchaeota archaeon]